MRNVRLPLLNVVRRSAAAALIALLAGGCGTVPARQGRTLPPTPAATPASAPTGSGADRIPVLLVSIDGARADYLGRGLTPTLDDLAADGVRARWMNPSYPSLTFPNHYTLVTGLRPDHHGIVNNQMSDSVLGTFNVSKQLGVDDGRWWGGEPAWVTAEQAGIGSATMFWPGSSTEIAGHRPGRWERFNEHRPIDTRVDTVLDWLALPPAQRPGFITLYFDGVDKAGHDFGPASAESDAAMRAVDAGLGRLVDTLRARGELDAVNLVVVSDHGMASTSSQRLLAAEDLVDPGVATLVNNGQAVGFAPVAGQEALAARALLGRHGHVECWAKAGVPARWQYGQHRHVPAIVCQMDESWRMGPRVFVDAARREGWTNRGEHGYDPALPAMRAIFVAHGPAFRRGATLPPFDNVDVYPLLMSLLRLPAQPNDGDIAPLRAGLVAPVD